MATCMFWWSCATHIGPNPSTYHATNPNQYHTQWMTQIADHITVTTHVHCSVSNHWRLDYLWNILFRLTSRRTSKLRASLAISEGNHQSPLDSPHKEPVMWKMCPCHDVIVIYIWHNIFSMHRESNHKMLDFDGTDGLHTDAMMVLINIMPVTEDENYLKSTHTVRSW